MNGKHVDLLSETSGLLARGKLPSGLSARRQIHCAFIFLLAILGQLRADAGKQAVEDPVELCKRIISAHPEHWGTGANTSVLERFRLDGELSDQDRVYQLLESPGLTLDFLTSDESSPANFLKKELLLELLKNSVVSPEATSKNIARVTLKIGLAEYEEAFALAGKFQQSKQLSHDQAISFLDKRYGYAKIMDAKALFNVPTPANISANPLDNKKIRDKLRAIEKNYPQNIAIENVLTEVYEFYRLLEEEQVGLAAYAPYAKFKGVMEQLNKARIADRRKFRSSITISEPSATSVWQLNNPVSLAWSTDNIPADKSLRFFLVKGEMVVQELGIFKNTGVASGIRLNKNIDSGDDYRVVGIEMFPANKYYIAKMATQPFSIRRPERKRNPPVVKAATEVIKTVPVAAEPDSLRYERLSFEGRKISYVKELNVDAQDIRISIWDHGRQDQDIVSIYLNGEPVVAKHTLTYRKKHFDVHLDATKKNDLFLYAHNLGFYPPNTVSIEVIDNTTSENIVLNSDLKSCEAVLINVRP